MRPVLISRNVARVVQARGMATEKQLRIRMAGTKNIEKITKSMKMVSAAKLRGDASRLAAAVPFAGWTTGIQGQPKVLENLDVSGLPEKNLFVVMSTDKGLCGGVNTILARQIKQALTKLDASGKTSELFVVGEKGRAQLRRQFGHKFVGVATDRAVPYNFQLASGLASLMLEKEYDAIHFLYNHYKSPIIFIPSMKTVTPMLDPAHESLIKYEVEPDKDTETLANFLEYELATTLFYALLENTTSEQSSRMNAMENASKNAGEMLAKLNLQYNRARQARITTELIEIISGASALEG